MEYRNTHFGVEKDVLLDSEEENDLVNEEQNFNLK